MTLRGGGRWAGLSGLDVVFPIRGLAPVAGGARNGGKVLTGIIFILKTGLPWEDLPQEMGCGCGMTCWNRLRDWQAAGIWDQIHPILLAHPTGDRRVDDEELRQRLHHRAIDTILAKRSTSVRPTRSTFERFIVDTSSAVGEG